MKGKNELPLKAVVARIVRFARKTCKSPMHAVSEIWDDLPPLSKATQKLLMIEALAHRVGQSLTNGIPSKEAIEEVRVKFESKVYEIPEVTILIDSQYVVGDGSSRSLMHFRVEDFDFLIRRFDSQIEGLENRREVMTLGKELLKKRQVREVAQLPLEDQKSLAQQWNAVVHDEDAAAAVA